MTKSRSYYKLHSITWLLVVCMHTYMMIGSRQYYSEKEKYRVSEVS